MGEGRFSNHPGGGLTGTNVRNAAGLGSGLGATAVPALGFGQGSGQEGSGGGGGLFLSPSAFLAWKGRDGFQRKRAQQEGKPPLSKGYTC